MQEKSKFPQCYGFMIKKAPFVWRNFIVTLGKNTVHELNNDHFYCVLIVRQKQVQS